MWNIKKNRKPNILVYADSRGDNLPGKNYYDHYAAKLSKHFNVTKMIALHKWTTTMDFLFEYNNNLGKQPYDYVVLHTGIVDYSPRHQHKLVNEIYPNKKTCFDYVFPNQPELLEHLNKRLKTKYEGDNTGNMYSLTMAEKYIIPALKKIPNLIWIGSNKVLQNWRGNYWKDRPKNMNITVKYSQVFVDNLENTINLLEWSATDIQKYTYDNIHPNRSGSNYIYEKIMSIIDR